PTGARISFVPRRTTDVHEHPPHHLRRHSEKMTAALPARLIPPEQAQANFVDQRRRLKRNGRPLARQIPEGHPVHLVIDERNQLLEAGRVAGTPHPEQTSDVASRRRVVRLHPEGPWGPQSKSPAGEGAIARESLQCSFSGCFAPLNAEAITSRRRACDEWVVQDWRCLLWVCAGGLRDSAPETIATTTSALIGPAAWKRCAATTASRFRARARRRAGSNRSSES